MDVLDFKKSKLNVHPCLLPGRITWYAELPPPGIEPVPFVVEAQSLNQESLILYHFNCFFPS